MFCYGETRSTESFVSVINIKKITKLVGRGVNVGPYLDCVPSFNAMLSLKLVNMLLLMLGGWVCAPIFLLCLAPAKQFWIICILNIID